MGDLDNMAAMNRQYEALTNLEPPAEDPTLSQRYAQWSEEHPVLNFGLQTGIDYAISKIPAGKLARRAGLTRIGTILDAAHKVYDPSNPEGFGVAPQYRDPAKTQFSEGYRKAQARGEHGNYLFNEMYKNKQVLNKVVENQGLNQGPYELTLYRGGRGQTAPGRGIYHTPDPSEAAIYENFRRTGGEIRSQGDLDHSLQRIDAKTVSLNKPFVQRRAFYGEESLGEGASVTGEKQPYGHNEEVRDLIYNLNLSKTEAKTVRKLNEGMWLKAQKTPDQPGSFPNEQSQLKYERYIMRLAKDRGYDSVVYHTPEMEHYEVALPDE